MALDAIVTIPARAKPMRSMDFLLRGTIKRGNKVGDPQCEMDEVLLTTKRSRKM
jgi:hypothetical protein